jgi:hypothetical protein
MCPLLVRWLQLFRQCAISPREDCVEAERHMRKVAALVMVVGLAGWTLVDRDMRATVAERLDLGAMQCSELTRAEPLCPLC